MSKELTPLQALKNLTEYLTGNYRDCFEELSIIETALKALEIIKKHKCLYIWHGCYWLWNRQITKEEFDLLKEVLL